MKNSKNIVIVNVYGIKNIGDAAIQECALQLINQLIKKTIVFQFYVKATKN